MLLHIEFSGGLEILADNVTKHEINADVKTIKDLVNWLDKNIITGSHDLFVENGSIKPGIIVIVNDTDYDVLEGENTVLNDNDNVVFVSTLHGG